MRATSLVGPGAIRRDRLRGMKFLALRVAELRSSVEAMAGQTTQGDRLPHCISRRAWVFGGAAGLLRAARPAGLLIDTHVHLFDPERFPYAPQCDLQAAGAAARTVCGVRAPGRGSTIPSSSTPSLIRTTIATWNIASSTSRRPASSRAPACSIPSRPILPRAWRRW